MKIPSLDRVVLFLIYLNGGKFDGKTNVHKNLFLAKELMKLDEFPAGFKPYFYGPFSPQVSESLDLLVACGLLEESQTLLGANQGFEMKKSTYKLTDVGKTAAPEIKDSHTEFTQEFEKSFEKLSSTGCHEKTTVLAAAAKMKLILSTEKTPLKIENIRAKAKELGWEIDPGDIDAAINVLVKTGLAKIQKSSQSV